MTFTDLLDRYGVDWVSGGEHRHSRRGWVNFDCPHCDGAGAEKYHMGYNVKSARVHCWKCGSSSVLAVLHTLTGEPYAKLRRLLDDLERRHLDADDGAQKRGPARLVLPKGLRGMTRALREYLLQRGFQPDDIQKQWHVGTIGLRNYKLAHRMFIPIEYGNEVVSWTTRSLRDSAKRRYISASEEQEKIPHKTLLYGEDHCTSSTVIVCEGPTDAWAIGAGYAVATFGVDVTPAQTHRLLRYAERAICFDSSREAQRRARQLGAMLSVMPGKTVNVVLDGKDPGSASRREISRLHRLLKLR